MGWLRKFNKIRLIQPRLAQQWYLEPRRYRRGRQRWAGATGATRQSRTYTCTGRRHLRATVTQLPFPEALRSPPRRRQRHHYLSHRTSQRHRRRLLYPGLLHGRHLLSTPRPPSLLSLPLKCQQQLGLQHCWQRGRRSLPASPRSQSQQQHRQKLQHPEGTPLLTVWRTAGDRHSRQQSPNRNRCLILRGRLRHLHSSIVRPPPLPHRQRRGQCRYPLDQKHRPPIPTLFALLLQRRFEVTATAVVGVQKHRLYPLHQHAAATTGQPDGPRPTV